MAERLQETHRCFVVLDWRLAYGGSSGTAAHGFGAVLQNTPQYMYGESKLIDIRVMTLCSVVVSNEFSAKRLPG